ncbi:DUF167 family protein [Methyloraptor flagellatus]|uniref:UPF0235 protein ABS361_19865 n=1 Tax=Methyloraptor flagellatus TaxID=3162530 RepID=A0AAU7X9L8_9HYPH
MTAPAPRAACVPVSEGVRLRVRLTPRAGKDSVGPFEVLASGETVLLAHVRAVPEKGAANAAIAALIAKRLGVAKTKVEVVAGQTGRVKTIEIRGDQAAILAEIDALG